MDILPFDWPRLLWGDHPPLFYLEILFRTLVIILWTGALLRWIGGRSISQLSIVEFLLVIALGSAVGDAMFYPEVPLFHAMLVILVVILADKAVDIAIRRWSKAKEVIDGKPVEILRDGVIRCAGIGAGGLGTTEVMEMLRLHKVENLGQLRRAYLEPSGTVSLFAANPTRPGLVIMPPPEVEPPPPPGPKDDPCCISCGRTGPHGKACVECGNARWTGARPCGPV